MLERPTHRSVLRPAPNPPPVHPDRLENLPVLPSIVARLISMDSRADDYFDRLYMLIAEDPGFAARVLRLANSAGSGPAVPISSLHDAISRLGAMRIRSLVTAVAVTKVFLPTRQRQRDLWVHSLQVATAARRIAGLARLPKADQETAYVAGLLHDLGRFVMLEEDSQKLLEIDESCWGSPEELIRAEHDLAGIDHTETGWALCRAWKLPQALAMVVRHHHDDEGLADLESGIRTLVETIQMADRLSILLMRSRGLLELEPSRIRERVATVCASPHWRQEPVSSGTLAPVIHEIFEESSGLVDDLMLGDGD